MSHRYVIIFRDQWDESSISFVLGTFHTLEAAQAAARNAAIRLRGPESAFLASYTIERIRDELPEWLVPEDR
jgi:hypothetical protein